MPDKRDPITHTIVLLLTGVATGGPDWTQPEYVTEMRNKKSRKILLDMARAVLAYIKAAGTDEDHEGPLFRPTGADGLMRLEPRQMHRKTP